MGFADHLAGVDRFRGLPAELAARISLVPTPSRANRLYGVHARRHRRSGGYLLAHG
jgi:hypothetical protein